MTNKKNIRRFMLFKQNTELDHQYVQLLFKELYYWLSYYLPSDVKIVVVGSKITEQLMVTI